MRSVGNRVGFWLGLVGHTNLVYTFLFGGTAALILTTLAVYVVSFLDFVLGIPLFFRILFYASLFFLCFALVNHGRQRLPNLWARRHGPVDVSPETEAQKRWRTEDALDAYFDKMQEWILDKESPLASAERQDPRRKMARTRTLAILKRLTPTRKRDVLQFLYEHKLISKEQPIVYLKDADLSKADLSGLTLIDANLSNTNLTGADLSRAQMCGFVGSSASWETAVRRGGTWWDLMEPLQSSELSGTNLTDAILKRTVLVGCNLLGARLRAADLDGTDVRSADMRLAYDLTQEQIEKTYGSTGQQEHMPDTLLPDYLEAPEAWRALLSQQQKERP